jgi:hypothetical protein
MWWNGVSISHCSSHGGAENPDRFAPSPSHPCTSRHLPPRLNRPGDRRPLASRQILVPAVPCLRRWILKRPPIREADLPRPWAAEPVDRVQMGGRETRRLAPDRNTMPGTAACACHANRSLPHRWEAQLFRDQSPCRRLVIHSRFKRALFFLSILQSRCFDIDQDRFRSWHRKRASQSRTLPRSVRRPRQTHQAIRS